MSSPDSNADAHGEYDSGLQNPSQDGPLYHLPVPPERTYPDKLTMMNDVQEFGRSHGYNIVVKTSSIPTPSKPHRVSKVWLRCDKGGTYRPRNGLTEENRKRKRTSRLMNCPFLLLAVDETGMWTVKVLTGHHNHPPNEVNGTIHSTPRRPKKGALLAQPYDWPANQGLNPYSTALVIIDMQRDFCEHGGYLTAQGQPVDNIRAIVPNLVNVLSSFRNAGFPVFHTREGHRPDLSTLSDRERIRSRNNPSGAGIGDPGPLGRFLIRGEPGHDTIPELYPIDGEPVIDKPGKGAFAHTDFDLILRNKGIKHLVICGVTTDVCVSTTMSEANDRGFDCLILEDGTAAANSAIHFSTLNSVKSEGGIFGAVGKSADVITAIESVKKTVRSSATTGRASSPLMAHTAAPNLPVNTPGTNPAANTNVNTAPVTHTQPPQTTAQQLLSSMNHHLTGIGGPGSLGGPLASHMAAAAAVTGLAHMPMDQISDGYLGHH